MKTRRTINRESAARKKGAAGPPEEENLSMSDSPHRAGTRTTSTDEATRDQCTRYLLGELDRDESAAFVDRLRSDPSMESEVLGQSEILCAAGMRFDCDMPRMLVESRRSPSTGPGKRGIRRRWVEVCAAVAASLLIAWFCLSPVARQAAENRRPVQSDDRLGQPSVVTPPDEVAEVAQAWAGAPLCLAWDADAGSLLRSDAEDDGPSAESRSLEDLPGSINDAEFDWMMAAVAWEESNDG
jgi:hypothetical protein